MDRPSELASPRLWGGWVTKVWVCFENHEALYNHNGLASTVAIIIIINF